MSQVFLLPFCLERTPMRFSALLLLSQRFSSVLLYLVKIVTVFFMKCLLHLACRTPYWPDFPPPSAVASFQFPDLSNLLLFGKSCWIYTIWRLIPLCTATALIQATTSSCLDCYSSFLTGLRASPVFSLWSFLSITEWYYWNMLHLTLFHSELFSGFLSHSE